MWRSVDLLTKSDNSLKYIFGILLLIVIIIHVIVYFDIGTSSTKTLSDVAYGELLGFALSLTAMMFVLNILSKNPFDEDEK